MTISRNNKQQFQLRATMIDEGQKIQQDLQTVEELEQFLDEGKLEKSSILELASLNVLQFDFFMRLIRPLVDTRNQNEHQVVFKSTARKTTDDLFEAALDRFPKGQPSLDDLKNAKDGLLLAAYAWHPEQIDQCIHQIREKLKEHHLNVDSKSALRKRIDFLFGDWDSGGENGDHELLSLAELLEAVPEKLKSLVIPARYQLLVDGITFAQKKVLPIPMVVSERVICPAKNTEQVELAWFRDGKWHFRLFDRSTIAASRQITCLADFGIPVTSNTASELVDYLSDFEASNAENLKVRRVTSRLGFHRDEKDLQFVLPLKTISTSSSNLSFSTSDAGIQHVADGFFSAGTLKGWLSLVKRIKDHPKVLLAIAASLTPPLFEIFRFSNMVLDYSGKTTGGKTTVLRLAASVWGCPDERSGNSICQNFGATKTYLERVAGLTGDLPVLIDDSKNAITPEFVAELIYLLAMGQGKGRGTVTGLQASEQFRTIAITTGERPLTGFTHDGGTRVRVIQLWGSPFGEINAHNAQLADAVNEKVQVNFGHAGPKFVDFLLQNRAKWDDWKKQFDAEVQRLKSLASADENHFASRMAPTLAAIEMAYRLAHQTFKFGFEHSSLIEPIWSEIALASQEADQSKAALRIVYDFYVEHMDQFEGAPVQQIQKFPNKKIGRIERKTQPPGSNKWRHLGILKTNLTELLNKHSFDADAILKQWDESGWLQCDPNRKTKRIRINGELAYACAIKFIAFQQAGVA